MRRGLRVASRSMREPRGLACVAQSRTALRSIARRCPIRPAVAPHRPRLRPIDRGKACVAPRGRLNDSVSSGCMIEIMNIRPATLQEPDLDTILHHRVAMFRDMGHADDSALDAMGARFRTWLRRKMEAGEY